MNAHQNMIIANGRIITSEIKSIQYQAETKKYEICFTNGKVYSYNYNNVAWLNAPKSLNPTTVKVSREGHDLFGVTAIYIFSFQNRNYWHICFENGSERDYSERELQITYSCLSDKRAKNVLDYLKQAASFISIKSDDGTKLLSKQFEKVDFVGDNTALKAYLLPEKMSGKTCTDVVPIFPFGCNKSQFQAVKNALENQISIIQGPPGTGKTQTILNIIANLLIVGKSVQVVSNNNSATANVLEKLASDKYRMDFLVASLGSAENKSRFIRQQTGLYPSVIQKWNMKEYPLFFEELRQKSLSLQDVFQKQERLALTKQELSKLDTEWQYFNKFTTETGKCPDSIKKRKQLTSQRLLSLWQECQFFADKDKPLSFFYKLKSKFIYGVSNWKFYKRDMAEIISVMQSLFYQTKKQELLEEIKVLECELSSCHAEEKLNDFCNKSMQYLKGTLYSEYGRISKRQVFTEEDLWKQYRAVLKEYPIVLSTTFSSRSSLCKDVVFDYLIMDEASQVDIATGALALSGAKNVVIVGDTKQLPNVVTADDKLCLQAVFDSYQISDNYNLASCSFLQSICHVMPQVPQTLLQEHYRCHPKIINFCNQKFYDGQLVIMSKDNGEDNVISVVHTVKGDHERDHMNQRQIDVLLNELLPAIHSPASEIGIIAPYNNQVDAIRAAISDKQIDVATVHKFQGREKDTIILTTVDDEVTEFSDDPYLLNVAVSRAKKKLCLVVSGNEQPTDSNIGDLVSYIDYQNGTVTDSAIYSVFDYLYQQYTQCRMEYLRKHKKISKYDSENLMYALIEDVIMENGYVNLGVICHQPLNMLIRNPYLLNDEECRYAMNSATHLDFLIYHKVRKMPVLAIEVDGFHFHKDGTRQAERDKLKNHILSLYGIPLLRFSTNGSGEKEKLKEKLEKISQ